jgi:hypothetical protein
LKALHQAAMKPANLVVERDMALTPLDLAIDAATAATLKRTPPLPARKAGVLFACTGQIARMRWKLESNEPDSAGD